MKDSEYHVKDHVNDGINNVKRCLQDDFVALFLGNRIQHNFQFEITGDNYTVVLEVHDGLKPLSV